MFSRHGEPVVSPPAQWIENSQNHCVNPSVMPVENKPAKSLVFMVEELGGGWTQGTEMQTARIWRNQRSSTFPEVVLQCSWRGLALLQLQAVLPQTSSRWSSGKGLNGDIPAASAVAPVLDVQLLCCDPASLLSAFLSHLLSL